MNCILILIKVVKWSNLLFRIVVGLVIKIRKRMKYDLIFDIC